SHFIPGIDDGAKTVEDSLELVRRMQQLGYDKIITTPHVKYDHYPNTSSIIQNGLHELQEAMQREGLNIPVRAAAEYYIDDHFMSLLDSEPLLTVWKNEVLVEISF